MQRRHTMPFGATVLDEGGVRFRLWAPGARRVELELDARRLAAVPDANGWCEWSVADAAAGTRYRYRIDERVSVPDPASRYQPDDVHGASAVIDPGAYRWNDRDWRGRPWDEAVLYELHVGSFTPAGNFSGVEQRLDYLAGLGVTAIELMPLGDFPGARNWGYDGVLPFAPDARYGHPDELKHLVEAAHARGLMVFLDVVYNHFGPDGNYLHVYAPDFFTERHRTPWGAAINFDSRAARTVRDFFIHNALYWLEEFHLDGLRLDAVHAITDDSSPDILQELAEAVRRGPGAARHVHLVLENDRNAARYLERNPAGLPRWYDAQWNDDFHHLLHVLTTGDTDGYYADFAVAPMRLLGRCLTEGFAYQGEPSAYRHGRTRGEPSAQLPPTAFVNFLQNHDQVGNRAFGERCTELASAAAVRAATAVLLLAPSPPLLFMGQEWASTRPFLFFCDFGPELAARVTEGRRNEFARFAQFADPATRARIPDPGAAATFERCVLDWRAAETPAHAPWLALHRELLALRARYIVPRLRAAAEIRARYELLGPGALAAHWHFDDGDELVLRCNFHDAPLRDLAPVPGPLLYASAPDAGSHLPPWSAAWFLLSS
jgi:malto-oligosyltrehalose trehalohydrolase